MKYLKLFKENQFNGKYDPMVQKLYDDFHKIEDFESLCDESNIEPKHIENMFEMVQEEIDDAEKNGELPEIYEVYMNMNAAYKRVFFGLYRAYGPCHAKIRYAIDQSEPSIVKDDNTEAYTIEKERIDTIVSDYKEELEKWQNIK